MSDSGPVIAAFALDDEDDQVALNAVALAVRLKVPILPVHAVRPGSLEGVARSLTEATEAIYRRMSGVARGGARVLAPAIAVDGEPSHFVGDVAASTTSDFVVVGSGEREAVRRIFVGSQAERIARHIHTGVWFARSDPPGAGSLVGCAVETTQQMQGALAVAARMARLFRARLRLIHVIRSPRTVAIGARALERASRRIESVVRKTVECLTANGHLADLDVEVSVTGGTVAARLVEQSRDLGLLVIGTHGLEALHAGRLGHVSEHVVRCASCSVVLVHESGTRARRLSLGA